MRTWQKKVFVFVMVISFAVIGSVAYAEKGQPSGTVSIETTSVAVGIGYSWGEGVLNFQGKEYKFKIKGISVVDVGVSTISAKGHVYHLSRISDFPGTFSAAEAGIALGAGAGASTMENQYGVVMSLTSTKAGIKFKLAPEGLKVQLQ